MTRRRRRPRDRSTPQTRAICSRSLARGERSVTSGPSGRRPWRPRRVAGPADLRRARGGRDRPLRRAGRLLHLGAAGAQPDRQPDPVRTLDEQLSPGRQAGTEPVELHRRQLQRRDHSRHDAVAEPRRRPADGAATVQRAQLELRRAGDVGHRRQRRRSDLGRREVRRTRRTAGRSGHAARTTTTRAAATPTSRRSTRPARRSPPRSSRSTGSLHPRRCSSSATPTACR